MPLNLSGMPHLTLNTVVQFNNTRSHCWGYRTRDTHKVTAIWCYKSLSQWDQITSLQQQHLSKAVMTRFCSTITIRWSGFSLWYMRTACYVWAIHDLWHFTLKRGDVRTCWNASHQQARLHIVVIVLIGAVTSMWQVRSMASTSTLVLLGQRATTRCSMAKWRLKTTTISKLG